MSLHFRRIVFVGGLASLTSSAKAHVKWFAPYIVEAAPRPLLQTLRDLWFWVGLVLVLLFFMAARWIENTALGQSALGALDRATDPLWRRLDDFVRAVVAGFFIAIFAVGGVYLTPDLKTPSEWVSWAQLAIAALIFSTRTMPFAAAGIIGLWLLALRDYDFFHLLDYLALGVGVAAYLAFFALPEGSPWRRRRFQALRIGVAIALMWSSLEKFAYPDWFYPLVVEKPFLTFGLPRDVFIPMAGVAEFTLGFGLLWSPLVRRLSAIALFVIFTTAVYPFGRIDLVGHALIMAIIVAIAADHTKDAAVAPEMVKRGLALIPASLAFALVLFATGYWGIHAALYGAGNAADTTIDHRAGPNPHATHTHDPSRPADRASGPAAGGPSRLPSGPEPSTGR
jgi:hypothetical protein